LKAATVQALVNFAITMIRTKTQKTLFVFLICSLFTGRLMAQESNDVTLKNILTNKSFVFKAQTAWPLQGQVIQLSPGFDMKVLIDSINTYLPYFGRAYAADYAPTGGGGINFTSSKFEYKLKERTKGGWELTIKPVDAKDVTQLNYSISTNGFATLQVISNNRQAISFYGVIEKAK
jgi:hypothetical protein